MLSLFSEAPDNYLFTNRYLKRLIVPLVLELLLSLTVGLADIVMVTTAGEAAVSGVSLVDNINNLIMNIMQALATGGAVVTAQFLGAGRREEASKSANQLFYAVCALSVGVMLVCIFLRGGILRILFGSIEDDVMDACMRYFFIMALSYPFLGIYNASAALFRSMGNSRVTLKISVGMNIINIVGNAICVLGLKMGVAGVALPSLISRIAGAAVVCVMLLNRKLTIHYTLERPRIDADKVKRILRIGIPSGIENGIFQLGRVLVVSVIATFGTVQIAANGVANSISGTSLVIGQAASLAMITVIGQCVGAGDEVQIRYYTKKMLLVTYAAMAVYDALILLLLPLILSVYSVSPEAQGYALTLLRIFLPCAIAIWPISFVLPNMLRACNDVKFTMAASIFSMFVFRIGFSHLLGRALGMGVVGVWVAMIIDWVFRASFFFGRYRSGAWRRTAGLLGRDHAHDE